MGSVPHHFWSPQRLKHFRFWFPREVFWSLVKFWNRHRTVTGRKPRSVERDQNQFYDLIKENAQLTHRGHFTDRREPSSLSIRFVAMTRCPVVSVCRFLSDFSPRESNLIAQYTYTASKPFFCATQNALFRFCSTKKRQHRSQLRIAVNNWGLRLVQCWAAKKESVVANIILNL